MHMLRSQEMTTSAHSGMEQWSLTEDLGVSNLIPMKGLKEMTGKCKRSSPWDQGYESLCFF